LQENVVYIPTEKGDTTMFKKLLNKNKELILNQRGQGLVEYALILVLIAVAIMTAVTTLKTDISTSYQKVGSAINH
jgi:pilus assembly protein Flp/PilA